MLTLADLNTGDIFHFKNVIDDYSITVGYPIEVIWKSNQVVLFNLHNFETYTAEELFPDIGLNSIEVTRSTFREGKRDSLVNDPKFILASIIQDELGIKFNTIALSDKRINFYKDTSYINIDKDTILIETIINCDSIKLTFRPELVLEDLDYCYTIVKLVKTHWEYNERNCIK